MNTSNTGSNAENIPPSIFWNDCITGSNFFIAFSEFIKAATNPPTKDTSNPIPDNLSAVPNDFVFNSSDLNPLAI